MKEFTITKNEAAQRLDKYLKKLLPEASSGFLYKMLRKKNITWNGKKAAGSEKLVAGDCIRLYLADETFDKFAAYRPQSTAGADGTRLDVIYEDEDILLINKPCGMLSQKAKPSDVSANEYLIAYLLASGAVTEESLRTFHPSVCNRLDRNTSGILTAGKSLKGLQELSAALKERTVNKYYRCMVAGEMTRRAHLKGYLYKDERTNKVTVLKEHREGAKQIETAYEPIRWDKEKTLLEVHLITGRSHQIRAHLASIGHPIIGDPKYGDPSVNKSWQERCDIRHQLLHAYRMEFADGRSFAAPMPQEFDRVCNYHREQKRGTQ